MAAAVVSAAKLRLTASWGQDRRLKGDELRQFPQPALRAGRLLSIERNAPARVWRRRNALGPFEGTALQFRLHGSPCVHAAPRRFLSRPHASPHGSRNPSARRARRDRKASRIEADIFRTEAENDIASGIRGGARSTAALIAIASTSRGDSPPIDRPRSKFIAGEPRKVATKVLAGADHKARAAAPTCSTRPPFNTTILSPIVIAST